MDPDIEVWWMLFSVAMVVAALVAYLVLADKPDALEVGYGRTPEDEAKLHRRLMKRDVLSHELDCTYRLTLGSERCDCGVGA